MYSHIGPLFPHTVSITSIPLYCELIFCLYCRPFVSLDAPLCVRLHDIIIIIILSSQTNQHAAPPSSRADVLIGQGVHASLGALPTCKSPCRPLTPSHSLYDRNLMQWGPSSTPLDSTTSLRYCKSLFTINAAF